MLKQIQKRNVTKPIAIRPETHKALCELKIHRNQSFDEVITQLIEKNSKQTK